MTLTEMSRRERKKLETRRRIFEAAIALFRERGFEATTVEDITERADVGRGTFFNYFPRKEAVLGYLSEERSLLAEENAATLLASPQPTREKLVELYLYAAAAYEEDLDLARYVFAEWMKRGFTPTEEAGDRWGRIVGALIAQGRESGQIRADVSDVRADALLSGVYVATLYHWLYCPPGCADEITDLRGELSARLGIVLDGLAPAGARA